MMVGRRRLNFGLRAVSVRCRGVRGGRRRSRFAVSAGQRRAGQHDCADQRAKVRQFHIGPLLGGVHIQNVRANGVFNMTPVDVTSE